MVKNLLNILNILRVSNYSRDGRDSNDVVDRRSKPTAIQLAAAIGIPSIATAMSLVSDFTRNVLYQAYLWLFSGRAFVWPQSKIGYLSYLSGLTRNIKTDFLEKYAAFYLVGIIASLSYFLLMQSFCRYHRLPRVGFWYSCVNIWMGLTAYKAISSLFFDLQLLVEEFFMGGVIARPYIKSGIAADLYGSLIYISDSVVSILPFFFVVPMLCQLIALEGAIKDGRLSDATDLRLSISSKLSLVYKLFLAVLGFAANVTVWALIRGNYGFLRNVWWADYALALSQSYINVELFLLTFLSLQENLTVNRVNGTRPRGVVRGREEALDITDTKITETRTEKNNPNNTQQKGSSTNNSQQKSGSTKRV